MNEIKYADLAVAQNLLQRLASELRDALVAKGYEKATAEIIINHWQVSIWLRTGGVKVFPGYAESHNWHLSAAPSIEQCFTEARSQIALLEDASAYDDEFRAPLFLLSEQHREAAE